MNFSEQEQFFKGSRIRGAVAVTAVAAAAAWLGLRLSPSRMLLGWFVLIVVTLAVSIYFSPDYLHLSVDAAKRSRWQIKIRWRIIAGLLVMALWAPVTPQDRMAASAGVGAMLLLNWNARILARFPDAAALYFWFTDLALLVAALFLHLDLLPATALAAASLHLAVLTSSRRFYLRAVVFVLADATVLGAAFVLSSAGARAFAAAAALLAVTGAATAWLAQRAARHNRANENAALDELHAYTQLPEAEIRRQWATADQELAANWKAADIAEDDLERLVAWYRENSRPYLFAISAYSLEYKKISANLKMLRYAQGACLDHGAGTGELVLELARRGHPAIYHDVEGETMKFARWRAQQRSLPLRFALSKEELAQMAEQQPLQTIFAFDVLEHVPHLEQELDFLASLLAPGGCMVFDVPAGSTKSHPMHLNHKVDVSSFLARRGMLERRSFLQRTMLQRGKYVFQKPE